MTKKNVQAYTTDTMASSARPPVIAAHSTESSMADVYSDDASCVFVRNESFPVLADLFDGSGMREQQNMFWQPDVHEQILLCTAVVRDLPDRTLCGLLSLLQTCLFASSSPSFATQIVLCKHRTILRCPCGRQDPKGKKRASLTYQVVFLIYEQHSTGLCRNRM